MIREADISTSALADLVRRFYAKARLDPLLGPVFEGAIDDWEPHLDRVSAFWSMAAMGVQGYSGAPLAAHRKHPLTPAMFDRWLEIWGATADEAFAPEAAEALKARAANIARSLRLGLFFDPKAPRRD